jgi:hypothetical protein
MEDWQVNTLLSKREFADFRAQDESQGSVYSDWFYVDRDGHSAMTKAIERNNLDIVRYVSEKHPDSVKEANDVFGYPLDYAKKLGGRDDIVSFLHSAGAKFSSAKPVASTTAPPSALPRFVIQESDPGPASGGALKIMILSAVDDKPGILSARCVTARGTKVVDPPELEMLTEEFQAFIAKIPGNPCRGGIGAKFMQDGFTKNTRFMVLYRGKGLQVYPYGFLFARPEGTGYFLDLICATQNGRDLLAFFIKWCSRAGAQFIHLHALPQVIGLYTKFGFEFRKGCSDKPLPSTKEFSARVRTEGKAFPKSIEDVWTDDKFKYVREMVLNLQKNGFSAYENAPAECFSPDLTEETFKEYGCGTEGYTMVRCRTRRRSTRRKTKRRKTRKVK